MSPNSDMGRRGAGPICSTLRYESDWSRTCARVMSDFEQVDILVNNAGVTRDCTFRKMDRNEWDEVININLSCVLDVMRMFIQPIINISSIVGRIGRHSDPRTMPRRRRVSSA